MNVEQAQATWESMCERVDRMPRAPEHVVVETENGVRVYLGLDDALDGNDPVAETVFTGIELALWRDYYQGQVLLPTRAVFDIEPLRALLADPATAARRLTETVNRHLAKLVPALIGFLENAESRFDVAALRGARFERSLWLYQDEADDVSEDRLPLGRLDAALLELLALDQTLLPDQEDGDPGRGGSGLEAEAEPGKA